MSRGRFGRTSRYGTGNTRRSRLGSLIGGLHRDVRAARACCLTVHTTGRFAGSGLTGSGASLRLRLFRSFSYRSFSFRILYRLGSVIVSFFNIGFFVLRFALKCFFCLSLSAALIAARLDLGLKRLQQTEATDSPRATGKNQEENSPTPRQHTKERQKTGDQGKNTQTSCNQQGNTARTRSIKVGQRRGLCVLHDRNLVRVRGSRGRFANLRNRSRIGRRLGGFLHRVGGTGRRLRKSGRG